MHTCLLHATDVTELEACLKDQEVRHDAWYDRHCMGEELRSCKQHSQRRLIADLFETFLEQLLVYDA
jgi:hypothetical protein